MARVSSPPTLLRDVISDERFKKAIGAAGGIERWGEKGFLDAVHAGLGCEADDGPLRRQVRDKLRHVKNAAAETPEAKQERLLRARERKATVKEEEKKRLRASRSEEEVRLDEEREEREAAASATPFQSDVTSNARSKKAAKSRDVATSSVKCAIGVVTRV